MKSMECLIRKVQKIQCSKELNEFVHSLGSGNMYYWAGFIVKIVKSPINKEIEVLGTLPEWVMPAVEHKMKHCEGLPLMIQHDDIHSSANEETRCSVLTIPFSGYSSESCYFVLGLEVERFQLNSQDIEQLGWYWSILNPYIFAAYKRCNQRIFPHITKRELECIKWASEGKTSWEISQILNISERTANFHLANCIEKTGSTNRQQAIVRCILQGQLLAG